MHFSIKLSYLFLLAILIPSNLDPKGPCISEITKLGIANFGINYASKSLIDKENSLISELNRISLKALIIGLSSIFCVSKFGNFENSPKTVETLSLAILTTIFGHLAPSPSEIKKFILI